jgi:flagellar hook-associated protein 1 FlgK
LSGGGEIAGLWEVRSLIIPDYVEKMNQLMVRFADALNVQHQQGYDLNGNQGKALFNVSPEVQNDVIKARYLSMVITNPNELAASDTPGGIPGNGDNAWNITNLRNGPALSEGNASFDEFIRSVVGGLGIQSQEAARMRDNQALLVVQIENQRQSVSGVSLDEEMTNLIKYQHAYGAAARMVTTVDEMLELIVSRLGIVGR